MTRAQGWAVIALLALILLVMVTDNMDTGPVQVTLGPKPVDTHNNYSPRETP